MSRDLVISRRIEEWHTCCLQIYHQDQRYFAIANDQEDQEEVVYGVDLS
jgi:hypothetical protein